jgi:hypothetical protein
MKRLPKPEHKGHDLSIIPPGCERDDVVEAMIAKVNSREFDESGDPLQFWADVGDSWDILEVERVDIPNVVETDLRNPEQPFHRFYELKPSGFMVCHDDGTPILQTHFFRPGSPVIERATISYDGGGLG